MYLGDKFCSPAKPSRCIDKRCLDLITSVENGQLHFQPQVSGLSLTLNLSLEVYSSTCFLAKHSALEEWKLQQQPENQGHVEI